MKKITLLVVLTTFYFGVSQELVINGDFENGVSPWIGNAANVVTEGGNSYNAANVLASGDPWNVNLSQVLTIENGKTYNLQFEAWSDMDRTLVAGIGLNEAPWDSATEVVNLTTTSQMYDLTFTAAFNSANSRVLFDMGADIGFVGIDNVSLMEVLPSCDDGLQNGDETGVDCGGSCPNACDEPIVAAPTPPSRPAGDVISMFSDAYDDISVAEWSTSWDGATVIEDVMIAGNPVKKLTYENFLGIQLASEIDLSTFTHFHVDFWVADDLTAGEVFIPKLSNHGNLPTAGETDAILFTNPVTQDKQWVSLDVELSSFTTVAGTGARDKIFQVLLDVAGTLDVVYFDNLYFHKNTTLGTEEFEISTVKVYPNPSNTHWTIKAGSTIQSVELYNVLGARIGVFSPNANQTDISTNDLSEGMYMARVVAEGGEKTIRLIKH